MNIWLEESRRRVIRQGNGRDLDVCVMTKPLYLSYSETLEQMECDRGREGATVPFMKKLPNWRINFRYLDIQLFN